MKKINLLFFVLIFCDFLFSQTTSDFENLTLTPDTFWNGSDLSGGFSSGNAFFLNSYDTAFMAWSGFAYSDKTDSITSGYGNQYSAITAGGYNSSPNYAVAYVYGSSKIYLTGITTGKVVNGFYVTNSTYAYLSMKNGDAFAKKFGGPTGTDPDWFRLTAKGWRSGYLKADSVVFYLADYRFSDSTQDYIVRDWEWVDLLPLGIVDSVQFSLSSTDTSSFGMNTPAYFCMDNFVTADSADSLNLPPVAADDFAQVTYLQDTLIDVLINDFDSTALPLSVFVIGGPLIPGASATVDTANRILYIPAVGIVAVDTVTYSVCDANYKCDTALVIITVVGVTGVEELALTNLKIYPNPVSDVLNIEMSTIPENNCSIKIFDVQGRELIQSSIINKQSSINLSALCSGTYFIKIIAAQGAVVRKFIKQ